MTDHTRSDIRLGNLSAVDATGTDAPAPRISATPEVTVAQPAVAVPPAKPRAVASPRRLVPARILAAPPAVLALGALVILLAGAVVLLVIGQRDLARSLAVLDAKSRASVATLSDQVSSTSTTLKSTDSETQKSLNLLASDIAKLDAHLARLDKGLEQQARQQADIANEEKALAAELHRSLQATSQADAQRDERLKSLADSLDALGSRQKTLADGLSRLEHGNGEVAQLRSEVSVLGDSLREVQTDYDKRIRANEQATASGDAFRRQVNATIERLNQQVNELYQRR